MLTLAVRIKNKKSPAQMETQLQAERVSKSASCSTPSPKLSQSLETALQQAQRFLCRPPPHLLAERLKSFLHFLIVYCMGKRVLRLVKLGNALLKCSGSDAEKDWCGAPDSPEVPHKTRLLQWISTCCPLALITARAAGTWARRARRCPVCSASWSSITSRPLKSSAL